MYYLYMHITYTRLYVDVCPRPTSSFTKVSLLFWRHLDNGLKLPTAAVLLQEPRSTRLRAAAVSHTGGIYLGQLLL